MAILRQYNALGQERVDVPHLRMIESGVAGDFDLLAGSILAGNQGLVVNGFNILTTGAIGAAATSLQLNVDGGILIHPLASESGSVFTAAVDRTTEQLTTTNTKVYGSFTGNAINFIGIDLIRTADASTADLAMFLDADSDVEKSRNVPLAKTLDYKIIISTNDFSNTPGVAPIAKVTIDADGNVTAIADARQMLFRLGTGGSAPNNKAYYPWPSGRYENVGASTDVFAGGDKAIDSLKNWASAMMSRMWEVGGGEYWYSATADRNVKMARLGTKFTNGEYFEWDGTNLHWRGLKFLFDNSTSYYNDIADQTTDSSGLTNLADGECIYVDIDRTVNRSGGTALIAGKAVLSTLGSPTVPGSRYVLAYRSSTNIFTRDADFAVGSAFSVATDVSLGTVMLTYAAGTPSTPKVAPLDADGSFINTASANNKAAWIGTGNGTGPGIKGTGGSSNGSGVEGTGNGTGKGIYGVGGASSGNGVEGLGGATNGVGVKGTGTGSGQGVYGIGGTSSGAGVYGQAGLGPGVLALSSSGSAFNSFENSNSNYKPQAIFGDSANSPKEVVDHCGFMNMGHVVTFQENWNVPSATVSNEPGNGSGNIQTVYVDNTKTSPLEWYIMARSGGGATPSVYYDFGIDGNFGRYAGVSCANNTGPAKADDGNAGLMRTLGSWTLAGNNTNLNNRVFVMEWSASISNGAFGGFTDNRTSMGLNSLGNGFDPEPLLAGFDHCGGVGFYCNAGGASNGGSTNWIAYVNDGGVTSDSTVTTLDTGVARTTGVNHTFRIESHGKLTPRGVAAGNIRTTLFFIDGALVAGGGTINKEILFGSMYPYFAVKSINQTGTNNGDGKITMGPMILKFNLYGNSPI